MRGLLGLAAAAAMLAIAMVDASADDASKYPDLRGVWNRVGAPRWDQQDRTYKNAPLTPEYRAIYEANVKDQEAGGQGTDPTYTCLSPGMPRIMNVYEPMEIVIKPDTTHILIEHIHDSRRIHTDGRPWTDEVEPSFRGYTIGKWEDTYGDGRYDTLIAETRFLKGPRSYDSTGLPFHVDNKTVIKEKIYLDKSNPNFLYDEITVTDSALTRPWTAVRKYQRDRTPFPIWRESVCAENNNHVAIGKDDYMVSADGLLMPTRKDQPPPDLRHFNQSRK